VQVQAWIGLRMYTAVRVVRRLELMKRSCNIHQGLVEFTSPPIPRCKKKISIILKCGHMYEVLNVDEIKN
jgi:hypothetical protein